MKCRRVTRSGDLVITTDECCLLIDNGCDQSIVNSNSFKIGMHTGIHYSVEGAIECMAASNLELVNDAVTCIVMDNAPNILVKVNQCLLDTDSNQHESLLQPHQARAFGVVVDDCARCHLGSDGNPGGQCIKVDDATLPLHFDGWKCYFRCRLPTSLELQTLQVYELTSSLPYNPQQRLSSRRIVQGKGVSVKEWRARLGYPTFECTKATLDNTTQMVQTLQAESREYLRDYYKTRVWSLRPYRINDVCYSDTFFSSFKSIRGYFCFQLFAFKESKFTKVKLMKREAQAPEMYEDIIRQYGAPNKCVTDNAKVCKGKRWISVNRRYCIETGLSVPHHQHQNYAEGEGGNLKHRLLKLFHNTPHAPIQYWCYGLEFLDQVGCCLSKQSLGEDAAQKRSLARLLTLVSSDSAGFSLSGTMIPTSPSLRIG